MTNPAWQYGKIENQILAWLDEQVGRLESPVVVGIDGRSGAGKSTLAAVIAEHRDDTVVIEGDQFYAGGSTSTWDQRSIEERASFVIDWRRQHVVVQELRTSGSASWQPFDWDAEDWDSDTVPLEAKPTRCTAGRLVLLEGAYSCRPELHDVLDLRVLLAPPVDIRRGQLLKREGDAYRTDWEHRWSGAEDHYFGTIMRPEQFDFVLGSAEAAR